MSGPREDRAQGREQGRAAGPDGPAAQPADWYLADTYAQDPYAVDPYPTEPGPDPYGLRAPATAVPPQHTAPEAPADPAPGAPAGTGTAMPAADAQEAPADPQTLRLHRPTARQLPAEPDLTAPAPRWASLAAEPVAVPAAPAAPAADPADPAAEYVGVDGLLTAAGGSGTTPTGDPGTRRPGTPAEPYVPPIEFDPPLSEAEAIGPPATPLAPPIAAGPADGADAGPAAGPKAPGGGKVAGLVNSSALMAAGTLVSRGTGFLRTMVIAAAIGVGTMGDSYNAANTLPTLLYILIGGGALNAVFVPQLVRAMKNDPDDGTAYANRLLTLVMTGLAGVTFLAVLGAPLLVQLISHSLMRDPASADTTVALARYCLPTIFFMGVHVVMGQILNARGRFGAMMWTPVLNNVVVIFTFGMYIWVYGTFQHSEVTPGTIAPEGIRLLGLGTLLGLAVQALAMVPYLRASGFRFRPRFDWRGHGLGKAARLAKWTFLFVLANQAGYLVITQLATAAGARAEADGHLGVGLAAYSNALLIWQLPMAVITVSVMSAVLPRLSRSAADEDAGAVRDDLSYGLRTSAVAIVPAAFLFLALGPVIGSAIYGLGNGGAVAHGTTAIGYMLSAFALGLIPYSVQYVLLRGFYAYEDTRTPFANTVWVAGCQAAFAVLCWYLLPSQWAVTGMALGYGLAYAVGVAVAVPRLKARIGGLDTGRIAKTYVRLAIASLPAAAVGAGLGFLLHELLTGALGDWPGSVVTLVLAGGAQLAVFGLIARRMRIEELTAMIGMVRARLGR
ncbi:murein biosynthesis integral membrane protein MurJ [Kitasatospora sp. NPDC096147]|uniref:murein biosynthesis integral membrane protein MurJ n=1 Tax=Kitasatospora sp. NPDC096147 TaxID=3364093 RepID=UPI003812825F